MSDTFKKLKEKHLSPSVKISGEIREAIKAGELSPGDLLPPERKMAESYKVNYSTIRKTTQILVDEGLLEKKRGKGILVKPLEEVEGVTGTKKLGLLLNRIAWQQPHYTAIIDTVSKSWATRGIELSLASSDGECIPEVLIDGGVEGIILLGRNLLSQIKKLDALKIPHISIGSPGGGNIRHVHADEFSAGFLATETLIKKGHEKIVYVGSDDPDIRIHGLRESGYKKALKEYGLELNSRIISIDPNNVQEKKKVIAELDKTSPSAIITSSRTYASFMNEIFVERATRIPEDLSVISLGIIELNMPPPAAFSFDAVGSRYGDITEEAVRALLRSITRKSDKEDIAASYAVKATYLKRGSVSPLHTNV